MSNPNIASNGRAGTEASSIFIALIRSGPHLIRMMLGLFWMYITLGWRVRKTRRAFEKQLVLHGMSKTDAERLSSCFQEFKDNILLAMKQGLSSKFGQD
ncbi:hypothetical protein MUP01_09435 [Candidatus Bathyarchaeota archaeon]|nr:hypothetical protein [Candidatus Bathyarchaeota archaeon]